MELAIEVQDWTMPFTQGKLKGKGLPHDRVLKLFTLPTYPDAIANVSCDPFGPQESFPVTTTSGKIVYTGDDLELALRERGIVGEKAQEARALLRILFSLGIVSIAMSTLNQENNPLAIHPLDLIDRLGKSGTHADIFLPESVEIIQNTYGESIVPFGQALRRQRKTA